MIGSMMMCVSVVVLLVGMLAGIVMGIEQDFALAPAHAHFNLIGGVMLFRSGSTTGWFPLPEPACWRKCRAGSISSVQSCFRPASRS
jgi:hypothetical protein